MLNIFLYIMLLKIFRKVKINAKYRILSKKKKGIWNKVKKKKLKVQKRGESKKNRQEGKIYKELASEIFTAIISTVINLPPTLCLTLCFL